MGHTISGLRDLDTMDKRVKYLADNHPHMELFIFYDGSQRTAFTAKDLFQLGGKFAHYLRQNGFQRHDVIANTLPNSPERLITDFGIMMAGCVSMNPQVLLADGSDFYHVVNKAQCCAVIVRPNSGLWSLLNTSATRTDSQDISLWELSCQQAPSLHSALLVDRDGDRTLIEILNSEQNVFYDEPKKPDDIAMILATSGSTGYSKLVPCTHRSSIGAIEAIIESLDTPTTKEELGKHPYFLNLQLGWFGYPWTAYIFGMKRVLIDFWSANPANKTAAYLWDVAMKENCSVALFFMPQITETVPYVKNHLPNNDFKLKLLVTGGMPLKKESIAPMFSIADDLLSIYGSTETIFASGGIIREGDIPNVQNFYCGKPFLHNEIKILDEDDQICPSGKVGNIHIKGDYIFSGYMNLLEEVDSQANSPFKYDGWFNTNDNGYFDDNGNIYVIGRQNDVIHYGPVCVYPGWLEQQILNHPMVDEVLVVPVPDPALGQDICAAVHPTPDSDLTVESLKDFCEQIFIGDAQGGVTPRPKYFMILSDLPRTATSKIDRRAIAKMAAIKFGQDQK